VISEETVRNQVRHIYEKIEVSSRAGAALFAMENDQWPAPTSP
jgi:DNA-binding CsgD family transcriptional regulator